MELRDAGKITRIGCSNFNAAQVSAACEVATVSYVQLPLNILGDGPTAEMQAVIEIQQIGIVAYNVLASGLLTGKYAEGARFSADDRRARLPAFQGENYLRALRKLGELRSLADAAGVSVAQYSIAWALSRPAVVATTLGIKNTRQLEENWVAIC